jgi:hypothetical protein
VSDGDGRAKGSKGRGAVAGLTGRRTRGWQRRVVLNSREWVQAWRWSHGR